VLKEASQYNHNFVALLPRLQGIAVPKEEIWCILPRPHSIKFRFHCGYVGDTGKFGRLDYFADLMQIAAIHHN